MKTKKNIFYTLTGLITAGTLSVTTAGTALAGLGAELLGITGVKDQCFS
ncbi:hypothetical protein QP940_06005 [Corynebacterium pseudodiphtheriticum]|uniref:Uncharacterized protein n=1 Tax=Corynebacterium pseudodiphtheriticum TaxID=37637 RepID=A0ABT7FXP5_9CORY|nr:hypothetical protein [Corynebacterium pseudodiphtheriticum]MDC7069040.1 hypothetical protein [Corynebacterium pseudodiphtheriticum]MDC7085106.1 hypothetical protein [Corynebacterium pseudodiphtheriticum]MDC7087157.1 hypothetical protein [Corynebacterium pseudodiphtheriticum]MDK4274332.1 hypothetical protein [Corynebacterium pseudodiphtheriticum]MDK4290760.1 hypothetical protein [Corynebacterium pseudodiphtheriticum]